MNNKIYLADGNELHMSELSGKLEGFWSLSTSVWENEFCKLRQLIEGSICSECYAASSRWRNQLKAPLGRNLNILNSKTYKVEEFPYIPLKVMRLESHGDISNLNHAINYIRLAKRNPHCTFTLWTKNHATLDRAIRMEGKPKNLICGISSLYKNKPSEKYYNWTDFIFTVYTADYVNEKGIEINCPRKCANCMKCYKTENFKRKSKPVMISEILKNDARKVNVPE